MFFQQDVLLMFCVRLFWRRMHRKCSGRVQWISSWSATEQTIQLHLVRAVLRVNKFLLIEA